MFQKWAGSVGLPPIDFERSISRNLAYCLQQEHRSGRNKIVRWDVADVEQALVSQVDGLLVQHRFWYHLEGDKVPCAPDGPPFVKGRDIALALALCG
jgi:hypothetical protein